MHSNNSLKSLPVRGPLIQHAKQFFVGFNSQSLFYEIIHQYEACLYLFEFISYGDSNYSHEILKCWTLCEIVGLPSAHAYHAVIMFLVSQVRLIIPVQQCLSPRLNIFVRRAADYLCVCRILFIGILRPLSCPFQQWFYLNVFDLTSLRLKSF